MYNRYIPQSDGSYKKDRVPEKQSQQISAPQVRQEQRPQPSRPVQNTSVTGFLRNILPKEFDTGDLLIVLLLLLMAEQDTEDKNTALLTLALYFFM